MPWVRQQKPGETRPARVALRPQADEMTTAPRADRPTFHRDNALRHAVCVTGLQRSYPEISHNIHYALSTLYAGWRHSTMHGANGMGSSGSGSGGSGGSSSRSGRSSTGGTATEAATGGGLASSAPEGLTWPGRADRVHSRRSRVLERSVAFFGVRPANDSWATVRTDLPPLLNESIQTPCGPQRPVWFSAYAKTHSQRLTYGHSFVQMLCDMRVCHEMIQEHERRVGRPFLTIARLRLDLAWETALQMPAVLLPNVIYTTRMNTKTGINDKWAIGRREPMGVYLDRVQLIPLANQLHNRSARPASIRATAGRDGLLNFECPNGANNIAFTCAPRRMRTTAWQYPAEELSNGPNQRKFLMTSEGFLFWALWRSNVSVGYDPSWMFCALLTKASISPARRDLSLALPARGVLTLPLLPGQVNLATLSTRPRGSACHACARSWGAAASFARVH